LSELRDLYQEVILDHNRKPHNFGVLDDATGSAEGHNPLCGDQVSVMVHVENGRLDHLQFTGSGCAISVASASMMTDCVKGKSLAEVEQIASLFHQMVTTDFDPDWEDDDMLGLNALAGVREFPIRVKCATLPWRTLEAALLNPTSLVSTE
jgi:nitrogen fixation NifU-like protein